MKTRPSKTPPKPVRPPEPHLPINLAVGMVGKTVASVDVGVRQHIAGVHESEIIVLYFTDGTALAVDTGSNAKNVVSKPEEFHVDFMLEWFCDSLERSNDGPASHKDPKPMADEQSDDATRMKKLLGMLMKPGCWLDEALNRYAAIKDDPERLGLCHNIAIAIIRDLVERNSADGWTWCRGNVDGGIGHSWVEYRGLGTDMGDNHKLRIWSAIAPPFKIDGNVERRDPPQTLEWAAQEKKTQIVAMLLQREIRVGDEARATIMACRNSATIERWLRDAYTVASTNELLGGTTEPA